MGTVEMGIRLLLTLLLSGMIGWERELSHGYAGLKTHMLVGVSAAIIALLQVEIFQDNLEIAHEFPEFLSLLSSDRARLISQVVSGIGFLGAGTIIVTKNNITGLTTAASIWSVACLGLACGMGYYHLTVFGFCAIMFILFIVKQFLDKASVSKNIMVKYIGGPESLERIKTILIDGKVDFFIVNHDLRIYDEFVLYTTVFDVEHLDKPRLDKIVQSLAECENVINCQTTNL